MVIGGYATETILFQHISGCRILMQHVLGDILKAVIDTLWQIIFCVKMLFHFIFRLSPPPLTFTPRTSY